MAENFLTWIDDENVSDSNVQNGSTFASDSQRASGFASGNPASAIRVNTALREATLVAKAIVELLGSRSASFTPQTTDHDMITALQGYFNEFLINATYDSDNNRLVLTFRDNTTRNVNLGDPPKLLSGTDLEYDSSMIISDDTISGLQVNVGDYYIVGSRYTNNSHLFNKGDIFKVIEVGPGQAKYELVYSAMPILYRHTVVLGAVTTNDEIYEGTITLIDSNPTTWITTDTTSMDIHDLLEAHELWPAPGTFWKTNVGAVPTVNIYHAPLSDVLRAGYISNSSTYSVIEFKPAEWTVRRVYTDTIS